MMPKMACSKCGAEIVPDVMRGEESLIRLSDRKILAANRGFEGKCINCGDMFLNKIGHHRSKQRKRLMKLFPKSRLGKLGAQLSPSEFRRLEDAIKGEQALTDGELARYVNLME
jgi:hypothetical protein